MNKIEAYKCDICNSVHLLAKDAKACQRKCKKDLDDRIKEKDFKKNLSALVNRVRLEATSIDHMEELILEVSKEVHDEAAIKSVSLSVLYYDDVSATHHAPIGMPTSWGYKNSNRKSYPGFNGRISFTYPLNAGKILGTFFSYFGEAYDARTIPCIHTNTGSATDEDDCIVASYGVEFFIDDFPALKERFESEKAKATAAHDKAQFLKAEYFDVLKADTVTLEAQAKKDEILQQIRALNDLVAKENEVISQRQNELKVPFDIGLALFIEELGATGQFGGKGVKNLPKSIFG